VRKAPSQAAPLLPHASGHAVQAHPRMHRRGAGFRGGFIFPLFFAGTAFGQALAAILPGVPFFGTLPPVLLAMTAAAGARAATEPPPLRLPGCARRRPSGCGCTCRPDHAQQHDDSRASTAVFLHGLWLLCAAPRRSAQR